MVTPEGRRIAALGDPELEAFLRSGAKPFQAMPLVAAGGGERFGLDAADLALVCASHGGAPEHVERAASLLQRGGFGAGDLLCGSHAPLDRAAARELRERRQAPSPLHNNCSGKHAGMLLACRLLDLPVAGYASSEHPLQQRILGELAAFAHLDPPSIELAVDGCSAPAYRLPLAASARAYAALADPRAAGLGAERCRTAARVVEAMAAAPRMVAGAGRFTTRLIEVTGGRVLGKEGADGFYGVAVRGPVALGLALKIADGTEACRDGVVLEALRQLGSLSGEEFRQLAEYHRRPIHNRSGEQVGELSPALELEEIDQDS